MSSAPTDYLVWTPAGWRWQGPPDADAPLMASEHWHRRRHWDGTLEHWDRMLRAEREEWEFSEFWEWAAEEQQTALDYWASLDRWARQKEDWDFWIRSRCHRCDRSCPGVDAEGRWTSDSVWLWVYPFSADEARCGNFYMVYCIPCFYAVFTHTRDSVEVNPHAVELRLANCAEDAGLGEVR